MKAVPVRSVLALAAVIVSACAPAPTVPLACCGPISYSTERAVIGSLGQPVPVTWSTGTGFVTLHQVTWDATPLGEGMTGTLLTMEVAFEANTGTVNYGSSRSWLESDALGRMQGVQGQLAADKDLHDLLPEAATLQPGQKDSGWAFFLMGDPPVAPVEIYLVEYETTTRLVTWAIDGPPQAVLDSMTTSVQFSPGPGPSLNCPSTLHGSNLGAPDDFVAQSSPIEAAQRFAASGVVSGFYVPPDATWTLGPTDDSGVYVTTDGVLVHAVQSPTNQTWLIDEVQYCST